MSVSFDEIRSGMLLLNAFSIDWNMKARFCRIFSNGTVLMWGLFNGCSFVRDCFVNSIFVAYAIPIDVRATLPPIVSAISVQPVVMVQKLCPWV